MEVVETIYVKKANLLEKIIGLIGKEKPYPILIQTRFGIHTFGLKFPIDILILDNNNKIVAIKENLKPNKVFIWNPIFQTVIELPKGTIGDKKLKLNNIINIKA